MVLLGTEIVGALLPSVAWAASVRRAAHPPAGIWVPHPSLQEPVRLQATAGRGRSPLDHWGVPALSRRWLERCLAQGPGAAAVDGPALREAMYLARVKEVTPVPRHPYLCSLSQVAAALPPTAVCFAPVLRTEMQMRSRSHFQTILM